MSELDVVPWTTMPSRKVTSPSLVEAPARMECVVHRVVDLGELGVPCSEVHVVFAQVVCATLDASICSPDYRVDVAALQQIGRLGFPSFTQVSRESMFDLERVPYAEFARGGRGRR